MRKSNGFTLIELVVSVMIVGVLASIITISVLNSRERGYNAKIKADIDNLNQSFVSYLTLTSKKAPVTQSAKTVDSTDYLSDEQDNDYGATLKEIFTRTGSIPTRPNQTSQVCNDQSDISEIGYCYIRQNKDTEWSIFAGLSSAENGKAIYGSKSGTLMNLEKNDSSNIPKL